MQTFFIIFSMLSLCTALFDFLFYRIPNVFCILIATFFFIGSAFFYPLDKILDALLFSAGTLVVSFLLSSFRLIGAGDAKFLTVAALWAGSTYFFPFIFVTSCFGGLLGLVYYLVPKRIDKIRLKINLFLTKIFQDSPIATFYGRYEKLSFQKSHSKKNGKTLLPYGVAIWGGCLMITYLNIWGS